MDEVEELWGREEIRRSTFAWNGRGVTGAGAEWDGAAEVDLEGFPVKTGDWDWRYAMRKRCEDVEV